MLIDWNQGEFIAAGGSCDYPVVGNVLVGITYGFGAYVGTYGQSAAGAEIRQRILDAVKARLQLILTTNGYNTNLGQNVKEWDLTPLDPALETFRLDYRDEEEGRVDVTVGAQDMVLPVTLRIQSLGTTSITSLRQMLADVAVSMYADPTWGGLANDTNQDGMAKLAKGQEADTASGAEVKFKIEYSVPRGTS